MQSRKKSVAYLTDDGRKCENHEGSNAWCEQQGLLHGSSIPEKGTRRQPPNKTPTAIPAAPTKRKGQVIAASLCTSPVL